METLRVHLLGPLQLYLGNRSLPPFPTRKSKALFSFLALHRDRSCRRDVLANTFWGERPETSARKCLRTELWRIRSVLEPKDVDTGTYLAIRNEEIKLNLESRIWIDVVDFENRLLPLNRRPMGGITVAEIRKIEDAVELYRGDFLEGNYDEWCLYAREHLRALYLSALEQLMDYYKALGEWKAAINYGRMILHQDPLLENVHRRLMRCYYRLGDRAMALRQYTSLADLLESELGVEPMEETTELYQRIKLDLALEEHGSPASVPQDEMAMTEMGQILFHLHGVHSSLEKVMSQLRKVLEASDPGGR